jgi:hypothetical protein
MGGDVGARHVIEIGRAGHGKEAGIVVGQHLDQSQRIGVAINPQQGEAVGFAGIAHGGGEAVAADKQVILKGALQVAKRAGIGDRHDAALAEARAGDSVSRAMPRAMSSSARSSS